LTISILICLEPGYLQRVERLARRVRIR
jgi:hypothetical protein